MNTATTPPKTPPTILEIWHGGIPHGRAKMPICTVLECPQTGAHSHTSHISDKPWSIAWQTYVKYHMVTKPTLIIHRVGSEAGDRTVARHSGGWGA